MENETVRAVILAILGVGTASALNHAIDEQMPACKVSYPDRVTVQACRDKEPLQPHAHGETAIPTFQPTVGETITPAFPGQFVAGPQYYENPPSAVWSPPLRGFNAAINGGPEIPIPAGG
jgi:hypothetical protein